MIDPERFTWTWILVQNALRSVVKVPRMRTASLRRTGVPQPTVKYSCARGKKRKWALWRYSVSSAFSCGIAIDLTLSNPPVGNI